MNKNDDDDDDDVVDHEQSQVGESCSTHRRAQQSLHKQHLPQHLPVAVREGQTPVLIHSVHRYSPQQVSPDRAFCCHNYCCYYCNFYCFFNELNKRR